MSHSERRRNHRGLYPTQDDAAYVQAKYAPWLELQTPYLLEHEAAPFAQELEGCAAAGEEMLQNLQAAGESVELHSSQVRLHPGQFSGLRVGRAWLLSCAKERLKRCSSMIKVFMCLRSFMPLPVP